MRYNRKTVKILTPPAQSAVSLTSVKDYLLVDGNYEDNLLNDFITAATQSVRQYIRRSLITETLVLTADGFHDCDDDSKLPALGAGVHTGSKSYYLGNLNYIELPFLPIQSVTSVKTYDRANNESTFSSDNYQLDEGGGRLYLNEGDIWPDNLRGREAVKIEYISGYGDECDDIPAPISMAIKQTVAAMYECRDACDIPKVCKAMLAPYKILDNLAFS